ncbi:glycosyltransferase family 2 protein [Mariprofundus ferrooxydans]|uniref:glycosyltransferase family 2 protein n=1 Tax=Mariprofundus ferrooxydans TaxID=314344 RepID=UPI0003692DC1|nr:glycosyltransferase family 2 protein [Mariprofundus ferrooxydans]
MSTPLVCICVPCYNAEKTIAETLESILNQTYSNIEIHIFDNASTDNTVEVVKAIADDRIYFHLAESTGTAESNFTRCLNLARGSYTAIFHSDDIYASDMVEKEVRFLESHPSANGVLTFAHIINDASQKVQTSYAPSCLKLGVGKSRAFELVDLFKAVLRENNFFFCPSAMIRTGTCTEVLKTWRGNMFGPGADLDTWFRIAESGQLGLINLPLLQYRVSTSHFSHDYNRLKTGRADLFAILDYWMEKPGLSESLGASDLRWYCRWSMRDHIVRANNAFRLGELKLAKSLLNDVPLMPLLIDAVSSLRGLKYCALFLLTVIKCRIL